MDHGRTGARYRFRVPTPGSGRAVNYLVNAFVALFAVAMLLVAAASGVSTLRDAAAREGVLRRLIRPPSSDDIARGRNWGPARVRTGDHGPVCYVERQHYVSGKNGGWRTDASAWLGSAPTLDLGAARYALDLPSARFDPLDPWVTYDEARYRAAINFLPGGRLRHQCIDDGGVLFADVCVGAGGRTAACAREERTTLTLGSGLPTARVRLHASNAAGGLALTTLAFALLALYGWRAVRVGPIVDTLAAWTPVPPSSRGLFFWGLGVFTATALVAWICLSEEQASAPRYVFGYAFANVVLVAIAVGLRLAYDRGRKLLRAVAPIEAAETARLARVGEGHVELVTRVAADAPTVNFPGLPPCAFLRVDMKRHVMVGRSRRTEPVRVVGWPAQVPIEDPSGAGVLETYAASFDLRARFLTVAGDAARTLLAQLAATPFGRPDIGAVEGLSLELEVSYLEPGESVYLLGGVQRIIAPRADASYRTMESRPVVADDQGRLVVHAGHEATLLGALHRERWYLIAAGGVVAATSASLVAACAWLFSRA